MISLFLVDRLARNYHFDLKYRFIHFFWLNLFYTFLVKLQCLSINLKLVIRIQGIFLDEKDIQNN